MTEKLKRPKTTVTRLEDTWPGNSGSNRALIVADVHRGIGRMAMPRRWTEAELRQKKVIYASMKQRRVLNVFRQLRTQLMQNRGSENFTVSVASAGAGEDSAALNALNLAAAFALDPQKTALFIDCNPYCPTAHRYMIERPGYGITDYLEQPDIPLEKIIYPSGLDRLRIIPAGSTPNAAAEQVLSGRMQALLEELKERYKDRYIIVNAPSMTTSSESAVLANYCDTTILIAPYGKVTASDIETAYQAVDRRRLAGLIYSYL